MYRAYCKDTGEVFEDESFRNVYHAAMASVKAYVHEVHECTLISIASDGEVVVYIAVNDLGYTIDYGSCVLEVNKDVWSMGVNV